jgi:hypothetical protein
MEAVVGSMVAWREIEKGGRGVKGGEISSRKS